ncbi:uncharacterized protein LOC132563111 [Ylistrum balloti]|uniref:uncharacterized protein LOC132563111 n=1 Tax=Ylistrum balloti TaxID=509963 RepID=UPI0029059E43|nr:uncharacterized protein LOC132563111 [Ylistrum balloti]
MGNKEGEKNCGTESTSKNNKANGGGGEKKFLSPDSGGLKEKSPSLQRIHQQSSTETSGLGETITSGFSSQESIRSTHSFNEKPRRCTPGEDQFGKPPTEVDSVMKDRTDRKPLLLRSGGGGGGGRRERDRGDRGGRGEKERDREGSTTVLCEPRRTSSAMYPDGTNFDDLFAIPGKSQSHLSSGVNINDTENNGWNRRSSPRSSIKSRTSIGSYRSRSGSRFLGRLPESAWTKWSRDRRASFRRRLELPANAISEPTERASTPIKKAREEGLMFVHEDLKGNYISEDDINYIRRHRIQRYKTYHVIEKSKKKLRNFPSRIEVHLSVRDWRVLTDYWEHKYFSQIRYAAFLFGFLGILFLVISVTSSFWINYSTKKLAEDNVTMVAVEAMDGLWTTCVTSKLPMYAQLNSCDTLVADWQTAVIGLMIFSASFGFVATILAILGVCTSPLPRKIYYFHSAGEIFLVCALSVGIALIIYPTVMELDPTIEVHLYGPGYGLGWGGAFFFLVAALCMTLDELVRESSRAKCCRFCFKSRQRERSELQRV